MTALASITRESACRLWFHKVGLGPRPLRAGSWIRTLGGVDAYLGLRARDSAFTRAAVDAAVENGDFRVSPAVRGCIYLVPEADAALALAFAADLARPRLARELERAGVTTKELQSVAKAAFAELERHGPLTTDALRKRLPAEAVRSLGEAGKRVGISSPLPPALRELEFDGKIERRLEGGRLDSERYSWRIPARTVFAAGTVAPSAAQRLQQIARRALELGGPISAADLTVWLGVSQRDLKPALAKIPASEVEVEGYGPAWWLDDDRTAVASAPKSKPRVALLPFEETAVAMHGGLRHFVANRHHKRALGSWGSSKPQTIGDAKHAEVRTVLVGEQIVGFWEFDPKRQETVVALLDRLDAAQAAEVEQQREQVTNFITVELGHARSFSLDTDAELSARAERLRRLR